MKVVVTGALGHIGSGLIRHLSVALPELDVVMVDNLATQRFCSLFDLPRGRHRFFEADILDADLSSLFDGADAVVHLAALTDAASSVGRRKEVEEVNFMGAKRVARACSEAGCGLLFASTTSVYGKQAGVVDESCPVEQLAPQSPYAASKLKAERDLQALGESEGLRFVILRLGTIFGTSPGMRFHTAVNRFVWQACHGLPLTVWRTAQHQNRPYLDLADAVRVVEFVLDRAIFDGHTYNVLTLNATVMQIVEAIRKHVPDLDLELVDSPIMNQLSYHVARDKFEQLGFAFQGDLEAGIAATVDLLRNVRPPPAFG